MPSLVTATSLGIGIITCYIVETKCTYMSCIAKPLIQKHKRRASLSLSYSSFHDKITELGKYSVWSYQDLALADVPQIDCDVKAGKIINPEFIAKCPPGCQDVKYRVYGTDIYASFSSVCNAAIHRWVSLNEQGTQTKPSLLCRELLPSQTLSSSYSLVGLIAGCCSSGKPAMFDAIKTMQFKSDVFEDISQPLEKCFEIFRSLIHA